MYVTKVGFPLVTILEGNTHNFNIAIIMSPFTSAIDANSTQRYACTKSKT